MPTTTFSFQNFTIRQDRCAMKVGTDGVLLGAWAEGGQRVLDVGTGTGVVALMMAQRFEHATIVGIDADDVACRQAAENAQSSPYACRVRMVPLALQGFESAERFDAIVSNPPFFERSLKNPDARRAMARHAESLPFDVLFEGVARLLSADGVFSAIVPVESLERFCSTAYLSGFYISRCLHVKTTPRKPAKRVLVAFRRQRPAILERSEVCLMTAEGGRSDWYANLTRDFYLPQP